MSGIKIIIIIIPVVKAYLGKAVTPPVPSAAERDPLPDIIFFSEKPPRENGILKK